jgi:hypothetical protein
LLKGATDDLNDSYRDFLVHQRAAGELGTQEEITPRVFQRALRAVGGRNQYARGEALASPKREISGQPQTQDLIDAAQILNTSSTSKSSQLGTGGAAVLGHFAGLTPAMIAAEIAAYLGSTRVGAKLAFGQYPGQKAAADALRRYGAPAGAVIAHDVNE